MTSMTEAEWTSVQNALCVGGLRECIDGLLATRVPVRIHPRNRRIMEEAFDDGDKTVILVASSEPPWSFLGMFEDCHVCDGLEHDGVLYVAVPQSGGGLVSVFVGEELRENNAGVTFLNMGEAKAYIQGRIA
jgi:hypothetical protein